MRKYWASSTVSYEVTTAEIAKALGIDVPDGAKVTLKHAEQVGFIMISVVTEGRPNG